MKTINTTTYTLDEYLSSEIISEYPYELEAGIIKEMPPESPENVRIAMYLIMLLIQKFGVERISNKAEIIISGSRVNSRIPDITVFSEEGAVEINQLSRSTITLDMLPPLLVVEVVSPGKVNRDRDYRYKRSEYAARGIAHYWIIDPSSKSLTFLVLIDGLYEEETYSLDDRGIVYVKQFGIEIDLTKIFAADAG